MANADNISTQLVNDNKISGNSEMVLINYNG